MTDEDDFDDQLDVTKKYTESIIKNLKVLFYFNNSLIINKFAKLYKR